MAQEQSTSCQNYQEPRLIIEQFGARYEADYEGLFHEVEGFARVALENSDIAKTSCLLELSTIGKTNAEYQEFIGEIIERKLFRDASELFFETMLCLDNTRIASVMHVLKNPTFVTEQEVKSVFDRYSSDPKYNEIIRLWEETP
jgi:hypothetical protein